MHLANRTLFCAFFVAGLATFQESRLGAESALASDPPKIHGETANGKSIELPEAAAGKVTLLVLGFSKQGGEQTDLWREHTSQEFASDPRFTCYTIAVLESVPALIRGMVKSGIRHGTPEPLRNHMVTTTSGEAAWKKFLAVSDSEIPYLVLMDRRGQVRWTGHGLFEQSTYEVLKAAIKNVAAEAK